MPKIRLASDSAIRIGQKLKILRHGLGLSQQQVADRNGMTPVAYSKMEAGQTNFNWARLEQLAKFYNVNAPDLVDNSIRSPRPADTCRNPSEYERILREKDALIRVLREEIERKDRIMLLQSTGR